MHFETEEYTFIRVVNGKVKESVLVSGNFDFECPPDDMNESLKKLLEDYKFDKKSKF